MTDWADKIADEIAEQQRFGGHLLRPGIARAIREERERCVKIVENAAWSASHENIIKRMREQS